MKNLDGWLDADGASTFSSGFIPSNNENPGTQEGEVIRFSIPGVLEHRKNQSITAYRAVVDVRVNHLK